MYQEALLVEFNKLLWISFGHLISFNLVDFLHKDIIKFSPSVTYNYDMYELVSQIQSCCLVSRDVSVSYFKGTIQVPLFNR